MSPKLDVRWEGPYLVVNQLSDVVFRIQRTGPRGLQKVVHYDRLKPYEGKPLSSWLNKTQPRRVQEELPVLTLQDLPEVQLLADPTAAVHKQTEARVAKKLTTHDQPTVQASVD